jgi:hypothetical protein
MTHDPNRSHAARVLDLELAAELGLDAAIDWEGELETQLTPGAREGLARFDALAQQAAVRNAAADASGDFPATLHNRILQALAEEPMPRPVAVRAGKAAVISSTPRRRLLHAAARFSVAAAILITLAIGLHQTAQQLKPPPQGLGVLLNTVAEFSTISAQVNDTREVIASAESSLTDLGRDIFAATGGALRAVAPVSFTEDSDVGATPQS